MLNSKNKKKFISGIILFLFVFNLVGIGIIYPKKTDAEGIPVMDALLEIFAQAEYILHVKEMGLIAEGNVFDIGWMGWEKFWEKFKEATQHAADVAFKASLHSFLKTLAIDTATWIASGDKGQKPMFITQGWGAYLSAAADRAAGEFIMTAASGWDNKMKYPNEMQNYNQCMEDAAENFIKCQKRCNMRFCELQTLEGPGRNCAEGYDDCINDECEEPMSKAEQVCNEKFQKYLKGETVDTTGRSYSSGTAGSITKFLCEPDLRVKLRISAGLADIERPKTPRCTFSRAKRNWDTFVNDPDFLSRFQSYWDPWENDVGIALTMHNSFLENRRQGIKTAEKTRDEGGGWKALKDVAGKILTPSSIVEKMGFKPIEEGTSYAKVRTGNIFADAVGVFADTLMGKLLDKWVSKGLVGSGSDGDDYNWIKGNFSGSSSATAEQYRIDNVDNAKAAKEKFSKVFKPDLQAGKPYSVLKKLVSCSDISNPGPADCVINQDFSTAVQQKLTVQEAINQGHINPKAPFGFIANGLEPSYNEGYPYRSLIILRKYRIIPVGWELAAEYIGNILSKTGETKKVFNIQELINAFDDSTSKFYKLVDPNWVLKAPELYCAKQGYGEKIISSQTTDGIDSNDDGDYDDKNEQAPKIVVMRDEYCADEQSCIKEDDEGKCLFYGYCTEENRIWDFQGESCEPYYNSCQIFNSPEGKEVSYIKKSLDFNGCNAENSGCEWHCASRDFAGDGWMCLAQGVDLDSGSLCDSEEGCEIYDSNDFDQDGDTSESCTVPYDGIGCGLDDSKARIVMDTSAVVPRADNDLYFDRDVEECDKKGEGCHEYIRTKPNLETNLIINPSFEGINNDNFADWVVVSGVLSTESFKGEAAFRANIDGASLNKVVDTGHSVASRKFIFSFYAKECDAGTFQIVGGTETVSLEQSDYWRRFSTAHSFPTILPEFEQTISLQISGMNSGCMIDSVQLEEVIGSENEPSDYKGYGSSNLLYLKKAPEYYQCANYTVLNSFIIDKFLCESNGNLWRDDIEACVQGGSVKCANFVFECNEVDVGCDLYTPANGDPDIPAVVNSNDFCPEECNGYDTYKQEATFFEISKFPQFIIPENEKTCSARYAGCSEFTNLDKLEQGGEAIEYYTYLRPCQGIDNNCATFYTWVGSEISGFQLKAHLLLDADSNQEPDPIFSNSAVPLNLFGICANYNDAISNPECYEFYSENGTISYHHYKDTKVCSDGCHPYRKTKSTWQDCADSWGVWNINEECVYEALPEESIKCSKSQNNCYEYKGNTSNNIRKVIDDDFEEATNNWGAGALSSESLIRGGHSLQIGGSVPDISYPLKERCVLAADCAEDDGCACLNEDETLCYVQNGERSCIYKSLLRSESTYLLSFWAKGNGNLTVRFSSAPAGDEFASTDISLSNEWLQYSLGPVFINWEIDGDSNEPAFPLPGTQTTQVLETLEISGFVDSSYIDNIILKEVRDDLFLIRPDLWHIPLSCNQNYNGNLAPQYMLGCKEYKSEIDKETVYLKSFDHLCGSDVVGCEALIDTFNSNNPLQEIFHNGDLSEMIIQADRTTFLVNSRDKKCKAQDKGCVAVGSPSYKYNQRNTYNTAGSGATQGRDDDTDDLYNYKTNYYINDPDRYDEILCYSTEVKCAEFDSESGYYYFKDPASQRVKNEATLCEYKSAQGGSDAGWYLKGAKEGGPNCPLAISDLGVNYAGGSCLGGANSGNKCSLNSECLGGYCFNWTGECPKAKDGCIEYIDPLSKISKNIVFNSNFLQDVDNDGPDGWHLLGSNYALDEPLHLKHDTLYTVLGDSDNANVKTIILRDCNNNITSPDNSMNITAANQAQISFSGAGQFSGRFYTGSATECALEVSATLNNPNPGLIRIFKTGIYYNIDKSINKESCNGEVDYETGCVLFNERKIQNNGDLFELVYDADKNNENVIAPQPCSGSECDSNLLVKTKPDRDCGEWLACRDIVEYDQDGEKNKFCLNIGLCDSISEQGECNNFVLNEKENQTVVQGDLDSIRNKSGFVKIGEKWSDSEKIDGLYPFERMKQIGNTTSVLNGDFEVYDSRKYPFGWSLKNHMKTWDKSYFRIIGDPLEAQKEGISYPLEGKAFLKFSPSAGEMESNFIDVEPGEEYILSFYVNTKNYHPAVGFDSPSVGITFETYNAAGAKVTTSSDANGDPIPNDPREGSGFDILECSNVSLPEIAEIFGIPSVTQENIWDYSSPPDPDFNGCTAYTKAGKDWTKNILRFRVGEKTQRIKLVIIGAIWWGDEERCDSITCRPSAWCSNEPGTVIDDFCCNLTNINPATSQNCCPDSSATITVPDNMCSGNVYFDDIKIAPALSIKMADTAPVLADSANRFNVEQTCRAYPKSDSLSCNYVDDAGIRNVGRYGYCLQYDHFPGNPKQCLMWWPVDLVLGEGIEEGGAYSGRYPLYYNINTLEIYRDITMHDLHCTCEHRTGSCSAFNPDAVAFRDDKVIYAEDLKLNNDLGLDLHNFLNKNYIEKIVFAHGRVYTLDESKNIDLSDGSVWYNYGCCWNKGSCDKVAARFDEYNNLLWIAFGNVDNSPHSSCPTGNTRELNNTTISFKIPYSSRVVQTVSPLSDNKYWSGRVFEGSNYITLDPLGDIEHLNYNDDYSPFGSVVPPDPDYEPYLWDSSEDEFGFQPLYYQEPDLSLSSPYQPRSGQTHTKKSVERLFAQSYGVWEWYNSICSVDNSACVDLCYLSGIGTCSAVYDFGSGDEDVCSEVLYGFEICDALADPAASPACPVPAASAHPNCLPCSGFDSLSIIRNGSFGYVGDQVIITQNNQLWVWDGALNPVVWTSLGQDLMCAPADNTGPCFGNTGNSLVIHSAVFLPANAITNLAGGANNVARLMVTIGDRYWLLAEGVGWTNDDGYDINSLLPADYEINTIDGLTYIRAGEFNMLGDDSNHRLFFTEGSNYYVVSQNGALDQAGSLSDIWPNDFEKYPLYGVSSILELQAGMGNPAAMIITLGSSYWVWDENDVWAENWTPCTPACPGGICVDLESPRYLSVKGLDWLPPENRCPGVPPSRPVYNLTSKQCGDSAGDCAFGCDSNPVGATCDYCAIPPKVENIKVNNLNTDIYINNNQTVNLTFNTKVDSQQLPLTMYKIDWGDGTDKEPSLTLGSGLKMRDKIDPETPHSFYHSYNYWDMLGKKEGNINPPSMQPSMRCGPRNASLFEGSVFCGDSPCCAAEIKIQVKDNWGWCNNGASRNECDIPDFFIDGSGNTKYIIVSQY